MRSSPRPRRFSRYRTPFPRCGSSDGGTGPTRRNRRERNVKSKKGGKGKGKADDAAPNEKLKRKDYDKELEKLHVELVKLQEWVKYKGLKVCIVFEGRDTAGKGGVIKAITERVSPRVFRVVALPSPSEREKSQMYAQRYMAHLPAAGEVVLFDRSWYNRAGVEPVMGFCTREQQLDFLRVIPSVERLMIQSGIILFKYWLEVSEEEQHRRFQSRIDDDTKVWKLSPMDVESAKRYYDYSRARDEMFAATDTAEAPWYVVRAEDQRRARLNCIAHLLSQVPYDEVPHKRVALPRPQVRGDYVEPEREYHVVPEIH